MNNRRVKTSVLRRQSMNYASFAGRVSVNNGPVGLLHIYSRDGRTINVTYQGSSK